MTLAERIQAQRKNCGMSQEKLAELMGVSRQAVTKWESGQSAPSTKNLFQLAEILGVTVDMLLDNGGQSSETPAEQIYYLYKLEEAKKEAERRKQRKKNLHMAAILAAAWAMIFAAGALANGWESNEYTLLGVEFYSYPFGWMVRNGLFWLSLAVCVALALLGRRKCSAAGAAGFALALVLGTLFGENPAGVPYGHGHYGWAIWVGGFLLSLAMGTVLEYMGSREPLTLRSKKLWCWAALFLTGIAAVTALVVLTMPKSFS